MSAKLKIKAWRKTKAGSLILPCGCIKRAGKLIVVNHRCPKPHKLSDD